MAFVDRSNTTYGSKRRTGWLGDVYDYPWLGLGLAVGQSAIRTDSFGAAPPYPTFPQCLIAAASKTTGHLLFGGINSYRYQGSLVNPPTVLVKTPITQFGFLTQTQLSVNVSSLRLKPSSTAAQAIKLSEPIQVTLDHGYETLLPLGVATALWDGVGAKYNPDEVTNDAYYPSVPCSFLSNTSTLEILFMGAPNLTLSVPMSHLTSRNGDEIDMSQGPNAASCRLNVRAGTEGLPATFGAGMLKNLYTAYDLDNNIISVALTDSKATEDHIVTIPSGGVSAISNAALVRPSSVVSPSPSSTATSLPNPPSQSKDALAIGLGVRLPVAAILCGLAAFFLIRRRRRRRDYKTAEKADIESGKSELEGSDSSEMSPHSNEILGNPVSELKGNSEVSSEKHEILGNPLSELKGDSHVISELP